MNLQFRARIARQEAFHLPSAAARAEALRVSEQLLRKCMAMDASDGRPYVSLGKLLVQQKRFDEARRLYEDGAAVTGGPRSRSLLLSQHPPQSSTGRPSLPRTACSETCPSNGPR